MLPHYIIIVVVHLPRSQKDVITIYYYYSSVIPKVLIEIVYYKFGL